MNVAEYDSMYRLEEEHWYFCGKRGIVLDQLQHRVMGGSLRILDAGCGTGRMVQDLQTLGKVVALDPSSEATAYTGSRGFSRVVQGSVTQLPFADRSFDIITALDVIEHVDDDRMALQELTRVLKPGGLLLLTVPAFMFLWSGHDVALHHRRRYRLPELVDKVRSCGLQLVGSSYFNSFLFPLVAVIRLLRRLIGQDAVRSDSFELPFRPLNRLLYLVLAMEKFLLRWVNLPVGVSVLCLAQKGDRQ